MQRCVDKVEKYIEGDKSFKKKSQERTNKPKQTSGERERERERERKRQNPIHVVQINSTPGILSAWCA